MNVDHPHPQTRCGGHSAGHGVRDVVKLQIQKYPIAAGNQRLHHRGPMAGEQAAADLEAADRAAERIGERARFGCRIDVQRDQQLPAH
jgi:hypothetical protein